MLFSKVGWLPPFGNPRFFAGLPPLQPAYISVFRSNGTERLRRSTCRVLRGLQLIFLYFPMRGKYMATETATEIIANETEIKQAMKVLRLGEWTNDLLDEIELDRRLKKSLEQFEKGETMSIEEAERIMKERFASGYYDKK
jgi:hypothetical protein